MLTKSTVGVLLILQCTDLNNKFDLLKIIIKNYNAIFFIKLSELYFKAQEFLFLYPF